MASLVEELINVLAEEESIYKKLTEYGEDDGEAILKKENKAYFGVGGGITYDSIEEDEYNETLDKAKALMRVL